MKIIVHGPAAGPGPHGLIESWAPGQEVEVDDSDRQAVTWARNFAATPLATLVEDVAPKTPRAAKPPVT
jgi:hypothetical protein